MPPLKHKRTHATSLLLLFAAVTMITISGFGESLMMSSTISCIVLTLVIWLSARNSCAMSFLGYIVVCVLCFCIGSILLNSTLSEDRPYKVTNFVSTFLIIGIVKLLSKYDWAGQLSLRSGVALCGASIAIIIMFWPGMFLHGWNPNSSIFVIPIIITGLSIVYRSGTQISLILFYTLIILGILCIWKLENRSSVLTLALFSLFPLLSKWLDRKLSIRTLCAICIASCTLTPFFQSSLAKLNIFNEVVGLSGISKGERLFNGREDLWDHIINQTKLNPLFGSGGLRDVYTHNLALDILVQYGWVGWLSFVIMVVYLIETSYTRNKNCIFIYGFLLLFILNTYENAFVGNGFFTFFPYILIGIALNIKKAS